MFSILDVFRHPRHNNYANKKDNALSPTTRKSKEKKKNEI